MGEHRMSEQQQAEAATETEAPEATATESENTAPVVLPDDHPLVKTLAAQKDTIRDLKAQIASHGEGERTAEQRIAALEERAVKAEREALVRSIQARHGISDEDASLFLTGADEDALTRQAERLAARNDERVNKGNVAPAEGKTPTRANASKGDQFAQFFAQQLGG